MDNKNNVEAFNAIASEQIELLSGYLQGAKEALNVRSDEMDERISDISDIIDLTGDWL